MKALFNLLIGLTILLSPTVASAHGKEKHGGAAPSPAAETVQTHDTSALVQGHEMVRPDGSLASHDEEQVRSEGLVQTLKSLHPATVHFPIGLFLMAALVELLMISRPSPAREAAVRYRLYGGAGGSILAVLFGWIHTGLWFGGDTAMQIHRWNGMLIVALGLSAVWLASKRRESRSLLRIVLFSTAGLIVLQGFVGGELAHGLNHLKL